MISYGFSTIGCPDYDVEQIVDLATRTGLRGVELRFVRGTTELADLPEFAPERVARTSALFADAGVTVNALGTSVRFTSLDAADIAAQQERARRDIALAAALGAPSLRVFGGPLPAGLDDAGRERLLAGIAEQLTGVARASAEAGVATLIETHDDFCTAASLQPLLAAGLGDEVGVLWDTLHSTRWGEAPRETWAALGPRIRHVHVKDAFHADADGFDFALTGEGVAPVAEVLDLLTEVGYAGWVNVEWERGWHPEIAGPEVAIPHFAAYLDAHGRRGVVA